MQRCPKCGYRDRVDWSWILCSVAFVLLYFASIFGADRIPTSYRTMVFAARFAAFLLFMAGTVWKGLRNKRDRDEYLKLNPSVTDRVKAHIRPTPSQ